MRLTYYCLNISKETKFMKAKNSKKNEAHKFVFSFLQRLGLKNSGKYVTLQNLSFYYTRKNIRH